MPFLKCNSESLDTDIVSILNNDKIDVNMHDKQQCRELQMNGMLAVSQGSKNNPVVIKLEYKVEGII